MTNRKQTNYYECVGIKDGYLYMLDYTFKDGSFMGATGTNWRAITQDEIDESRNNIEDRCEDLWKEAVSHGNYKGSLDDFCQGVLNEMPDDEIPFQDTSGVHHIPQEIKDKYFPDAVSFACTGGGRCFEYEMEFDTVIDASLLKIINKFEPKNKAA